MGQRRDELLERAVRLPEWSARLGREPVVQKAQGPRIYDVDNVGFIDYTAAGGAAIVGYANQFVLDAVKKVLTAAVPGGFHQPAEVELVQVLEGFVPWADTWYFQRNHEEALRLVLRWIRHRTGRPYVLVLDGGSPRLGSDLWLETPPGHRSSPVREVPAWNLEKIEAALTAGASKVGALVVDPILSRFGVVPPPEGVLARLAEVCREVGVAFVLDEGITGFRVARGGAAALAGVVPDVAVYGGPLGAGFPLGAIAVREGFGGETLVDEGPLPVPHPVSLAAAEAVLSILKNDSVYERLEERTTQLVEGLAALAERFGRPLQVNRLGSIFALSLGPEPVRDRASWEASDREGYARFSGALLEEGVLLPQQASSPAFVSSAHGAKDIEETLSACEAVLMRLHQEDLP